MLLKDKVAVVTGGTRGIGKAILSRFAEEGAIVAGVYASSHDAARDMERQFLSEGKSLKFYHGSVADPEFVRGMMHDIYQTYGKIDVLVNNAGITRDAFSAQMTSDEWKQVLHTNFIGTCCCSMEVLPYMERLGSGKIVNMVSVSGVLGREGQTNYGASKGAIIGLTKMLSRKYAGKGIDCNALAPGMIDTEMVEQVQEDKITQFLAYTNKKRLGTIHEIADAALFLASSMSGYLSGTVIKADGGFLR